MDAPHSALKRTLGLFDSTMIVVGSMIGSGIFIVSAEMSRNVGSSGWLLASWLITGLLTLSAALSCGELGAMMPHAGGQYVYLREAFSPLWGFLYGWSLFMVIQTGTIAAVGVAFARYLGVLVPAIGESNYIIAPIHFSNNYAVSLSTAQLIAILVIVFLTWTNARGVQYGKHVQNFFTVAKMGSLLALIALGILVGWNRLAVGENFGDLWSARGFVPVGPGITPETAFGLVIALCIAQTGSLFSSDAWNNVTFIAGVMDNPRRNLPMSLALGTGIVTALYLLANLAYLVVLPLSQIQSAPLDRVATAMVGAIVPAAGTALMAVAIMISTFGCINGMILAGARVFYAMALDKVFFRGAASLNSAQVPGKALAMQAVWTAFLVLPRTYDPATGKFGNLYSNLLDYVISAALIFYVLTVAGIFVLRSKRPGAARPYRAFGYPLIPALYIAGASFILVILFLYRPATTLPGLVIVMIGLPVYAWFRRTDVQSGRA